MTEEAGREVGPGQGRRPARWTPASSTSPTCAAAGAKVTGIPIPADVNASTEYPIAALTHGTRTPAAATAFVAYVLSAAGQQVLTAGRLRSSPDGRVRRSPGDARAPVPGAARALAGRAGRRAVPAAAAARPARPRALAGPAAHPARQPRCCDGAAAVAGVRDRRDRRCRSCSACRWPGCWPGPGCRGIGAAARAGHPAAGAAAGGRRRGAAAGLRPARASSAGTSTTGSA